MTVVSLSQARLFTSQGIRVAGGTSVHMTGLGLKDACFILPRCLPQGSVGRIWISKRLTMLIDLSKSKSEAVRFPAEKSHRSEANVSAALYLIWNGLARIAEGVDRSDSTTSSGSIPPWGRRQQVCSARLMVHRHLHKRASRSRIKPEAITRKTPPTQPPRAYLLSRPFLAKKGDCSPAVPPASPEWPCCVLRANAPSDAYPCTF